MLEWRFVLVVMSAVLFAGIAVQAGGAVAQNELRVEVVPQMGHSSAVDSAVLSADGRTALSGSGDGTLKLWDAATGKELRTFVGHSGAVLSVALFSDGRTALSGSQDRTLKLWDTATGKELRSFTGHVGEVWSVALSADGRTALSGSEDRTLKLWDTTTGKELRTFTGHTDWITSVALSADSRTALSGSEDGTLKLWDTATGQELRTFTGHTGGVLSVALSADSRTALSGSRDKAVKLWDTATGKELRSFTGHNSLVWSVTLFPDGRAALSGSGDGTLKLWDTATGKELRTFTGHTSGLRSVALSADSAAALSGSWDMTLRLWDIATGKELRTFTGHTSPVWSVALFPDGHTALSGNGDGTLKLWDTATGKELRTFTGHTGSVLSVALFPDGRTALSGGRDGKLKLWDTIVGTELRTFAGHDGEVWSVAISTDGRTALSGCEYGMLKLWDTATGKELRSFTGHNGPVLSVAFSQDGRTALSGSWDNTLKLWDTTTGKELRSFTGHNGPVRSVALSRDGHTALSGSWDNTLKLWDTTTGKELRSFTGHNGEIMSEVLSPDGHTVLSGSLDNTLKLWDTATGKELRTFTGHTGAVLSVALSLDGRFALSGSQDGAIRVWDAEKSEELARMMAMSDGEWLTMTPAGFFTTSPKGAEMLSVVRGLESYSVLQFYERLARPDLVAELLKGDPEGKYRSAANSLNLETILNSGPAPKLERLNREKKTEGQAELAVRLTDRGGGIGDKVIWRVNGDTQGTATAPGLGGSVSPGHYVVVEQTLRFDPNRTNEVEVVAYNGKGLLATPPLRFTIDRVFDVSDRPPRLFVLAVGVNEYLKADWRLSNAVNDAKALGAALKAVGGSIFGDRIEVIQVLDSDATVAGIDAAFDKLKAEMKPGDVFVLFLSGHGRSIAGSGPGTGWFFLPQDLDLGPQTVEKNGIGQDKWRDWLASLPSGPSLTILDACESGANEAFKGGDREHDTVIGQLQYATGRNVIAAAPQGKAAYEGYQGHGVLTYAILEALNKQDGAADEMVDVYGVAANVSRRVPEISLSQFGIRQKPEPVLKDNFPLGFRKNILPPLPVVECKLPDQAGGPSHIISRPVNARDKPSDAAAVTISLPRNALVTLKSCAGAWGLVVRSGKEIGYVPLTAMETVN